LAYKTAADLDRCRRHLETLRIDRLVQWDVLAFIYRHGTSLASAQQIALLVGYPRAPVGAALDSLASNGLLQRSRSSGGVRLYRFALAVADNPRQQALEELLKMAEPREGRLLLIGHLRQNAADKDRQGRGGLHLA
jgi:DNA-binding MarR family transcriptional regulator